MRLCHSFFSSICLVLLFFVQSQTVFAYEKWDPKCTYSFSQNFRSISATYLPAINEDVIHFTHDQYYLLARFTRDCTYYFITAGSQGDSGYYADVSMVTINPDRATALSLRAKQPRTSSAVTDFEAKENRVTYGDTDAFGSRISGIANSNRGRYYYISEQDHYLGALNTYKSIYFRKTQQPVENPVDVKAIEWTQTISGQSQKVDLVAVVSTEKDLISLFLAQDVALQGDELQQYAEELVARGQALLQAVVPLTVYDSDKTTNGKEIKLHESALAAGNKLIAQGQDLQSSVTPAAVLQTKFKLMAEINDIDRPSRVDMMAMKDGEVHLYAISEPANQLIFYSIAPCGYPVKISFIPVQAPSRINAVSLQDKDQIYVTSHSTNSLWAFEVSPSNSIMTVAKADVKAPADLSALQTANETRLHVASLDGLQIYIAPSDPKPTETTQPATTETTLPPTTEPTSTTPADTKHSWFNAPNYFTGFGSGVVITSFMAVIVAKVILPLGRYSSSQRGGYSPI